MRCILRMELRVVFEKTHEEIVNGVLVVLYHEDLKLIQKKITKIGGKIPKEIFVFPGGHRFYFIDPAGNELLVWSEK